MLGSKLNQSITLQIILKTIAAGLLQFCCWTSSWFSWLSKSSKSDMFWDLSIMASIQLQPQATILKPLDNQLWIILFLAASSVCIVALLSRDYTAAPSVLLVSSLLCATLCIVSLFLLAVSLCCTSKYSSSKEWVNPLYPAVSFWQQPSYCGGMAPVFDNIRCWNYRNGNWSTWAVCGL